MIYFQKIGIGFVYSHSEQRILYFDKNLQFKTFCVTNRGTKARLLLDETPKHSKFNRKGKDSFLLNPQLKKLRSITKSFLEKGESRSCSATKFSRIGSVGYPKKLKERLSFVPPMKTRPKTNFKSTPSSTGLFNRPSQKQKVKFCQTKTLSKLGSNPRLHNARQRKSLRYRAKKSVFNKSSSFMASPLGEKLFQKSSKKSLSETFLNKFYKKTQAHRSALKKQKAQKPTLGSDDLDSTKGLFERYINTSMNG
jgi:hypothetical protein